MGGLPSLKSRPEENFWKFFVDRLLLPKEGKETIGAAVFRENRPAVSLRSRRGELAIFEKLQEMDQPDRDVDAVVDPKKMELVVRLKTRSRTLEPLRRYDSQIILSRGTPYLKSAF